MILYVYDGETNKLLGRIKGESNDACEAKANAVFGSNDVTWTYAQNDDLEFDGDCQDFDA